MVQLKVCILNSINSRQCYIPSMALSENVNHLVHIVDNDLISIGALNTDYSEAIESMLSHDVMKVSLQPPE